LLKKLPTLLQVGAQTETELKEKKLRVEDALNATKVKY
jgi:chaperonin GroEL (HSP60 family)